MDNKAAFFFTQFVGPGIAQQTSRCFWLSLTSKSLSASIFVVSKIVGIRRTWTICFGF